MKALKKGRLLAKVCRVVLQTLIGSASTPVALALIAFYHLGGWQAGAVSWVLDNSAFYGLELGRIVWAGSLRDT